MRLNASPPPAETRRWVPRQKAAVVAAVRGGALSLEDACKRYRLTEEEFHSWQEALDRNGLDGLRSSMLAERRKAPRRAVEEACSILLNAGEVECLIKDIGAQGGRLELAAPASLPRTFRLRCRRNRRSLWASIVWQRGTSVGVRFETPLSARAETERSIADWLLSSGGA